MPPLRLPACRSTFRLPMRSLAVACSLAGASLAARARAASVKTDFSYAPPFDGSKSKTTLQPLAGLGIGYAVTPALRVGLDYDITRFKAHDTRGPLQMLGLAMQYSF